MKIYKLDDRYGFECPGCGCLHYINSTWNFNNDFDKPTVTPSILVKTGHYCSQHKAGDHCWCSYNKEHPESNYFKCGICHSFITNGKIQFLNDCTHKLAGKTVDMLDVE